MVPIFMPVKRSWKRSSILISLCLCLIVLIACTQRPRDAGAVAEEFFDAFRTVDLDKAKSVTVSEQWSEIEEWMQYRQFYRCRKGDWDGTGNSGSGVILSSTNESRWGFHYQCVSEITPYAFEINDIWLKETDTGWKVYKWGAICETFSYPGDYCPLEEP